VASLLVLTTGGLLELEAGELTADGTGLLRAKVERLVLLVLVEGAQLRLLVLVQHGLHTSDALAHNLTVVREANQQAAEEESREYGWVVGE
jgi:hypothetical protein